MSGAGTDEGQNLHVRAEDLRPPTDDGFLLVEEDGLALHRSDRSRSGARCCSPDNPVRCSDTDRALVVVALTELGLVDRPPLGAKVPYSTRC